MLMMPRCCSFICGSFSNWVWLQISRRIIGEHLWYLFFFFKYLVRNDRKQFRFLKLLLQSVSLTRFPLSTRLSQIWQEDVFLGEWPSLLPDVQQSGGFSAEGADVLPAEGQGMGGGISFTLFTVLKWIRATDQCAGGTLLSTLLFSSA